MPGFGTEKEYLSEVANWRSCLVGAVLSFSKSQVRAATAQSVLVGIFITKYLRTGTEGLA